MVAGDPSAAGKGENSTEEPPVVARSNRLLSNESRGEGRSTCISAMLGPPSAHETDIDTDSVGLRPLDD